MTLSPYDKIVRLRVKEETLTKSACDIELYVERTRRRGAEIEIILARTVSFIAFEQLSGARKVRMLNRRGNVREETIKKLYGLAWFALNPKGRMLDEVRRRESGEITDELVADEANSFIRSAGIEKLQSLREEDLLAKIGTSLRQPCARTPYSLGLLNAVFKRVSLELEVEEIRAKLRTERHQTHAAV